MKTCAIPASREGRVSFSEEMGMLSGFDTLITAKMPTA
jgi:hypothetical protein